MTMVVLVGTIMGQESGVSTSALQEMEIPIPAEPAVKTQYGYQSMEVQDSHSISRI